MANFVHGTFKQIPYWKLRLRMREYGFRDMEAAEAVGMRKDLMSSRLTGKSCWTAREILALCELLEIPSDRVGEFFFPMLMQTARRAEG